MSCFDSFSLLWPLWFSSRSALFLTMHTPAVAAVGFMVAACALERSMAARGLRMYEAADTALQEAGMASLGVVTDIGRYKAVLWRGMAVARGVYRNAAYRGAYRGAAYGLGAAAVGAAAARRMGRALAKPMMLGGPMLSMGFAALYPCYRLRAEAGFTRRPHQYQQGPQETSALVCPKVCTDRERTSSLRHAGQAQAPIHPFAHCKIGRMIAQRAVSESKN